LTCGSSVASCGDVVVVIVVNKGGGRKKGRFLGKRIGTKGFRRELADRFLLSYSERIVVYTVGVIFFFQKMVEKEKGFKQFSRKGEQ